jgi:hypothetical protein
MFGASSVASTCSCEGLFSFEQQVPDKFTASADGVEKTVTIRANVPEVSRISLTVANDSKSPAPVQVELPDALGAAPVHVEPARARTIELCASAPCGERFRLIVRSLGEAAMVGVTTTIDGIANECSAVRVGATIE